MAGCTNSTCDVATPVLNEHLRVSKDKTEKLNVGLVTLYLTTINITKNS